ncbi:hypothetical protein PV327_001563 [Microctonus hyperodae]|uniref:Uncharacterized protein n=1 Tax=Microctonus hyperodae TaxID=165561 RepID=A0AA39G9R7_MICHY|nr:hypothetical protein PV327_001563 [Microctonus hyperodae]
MAFCGRVKSSSGQLIGSHSAMVHNYPVPKLRQKILPDDLFQNLDTASPNRGPNHQIDKNNSRIADQKLESTFIKLDRSPQFHDGTMADLARATTIEDTPLGKEILTDKSLIIVGKIVDAAYSMKALRGPH